MSDKRKKSSPAINLIAGGAAGLFEALCCHPLDTIKVRMQIFRNTISKDTSGSKPPGFIKTGRTIYHNEGFLALYKGLGAVVIGIIPKMAIRFSSYEWYRTLLSDKQTGHVSTGNTFLSGLMAGVTEAVMVVNPMEVVKIRLQAQHLNEPATKVTENLITTAATAATSNGATANIVVAPSTTPRFRNAVHAVYTIVKEEGFGALYKGVSLTAARQATNQGANFTVYSKSREFLQRFHGTDSLPSWETSLIGLFSGAIGPFSNAPLDTIKTRLQKEKTIKSKTEKTSSWNRIATIGSTLVKEEGFAALYKGITPRVMRVAPGQAVTFTVYEFVRAHLERWQVFSDKTSKQKKLN